MWFSRGSTLPCRRCIIILWIIMSRHVFLVSVNLLLLLFVGRIYTNHTYVSSFLKFGHITGRIFTTSQSLFMSTDGVFGSPDRSVGIFMSYSTGPLTISLDSCGLMIHCLLYLDWFYIRMEGALNGPLTFLLLAKFDLCSICSQNFNECSLARAPQIFPVAHMLTFLSVFLISYLAGAWHYRIFPDFL